MSCPSSLRIVLGGLALALAGLGTACDEGPASIAKQQNNVNSAVQSGKAKVPAGAVGTWVLKSIECYEDSQETPPKHLPQATLIIQPDAHWEMSVEGFPMFGVLEVHDFVDGLKLSLNPTSLIFELRNGRLENWSEGEAPYVCGRIFERRVP